MKAASEASPALIDFLGSLSGAAIGLIALLLAALYNAHLNRKRDDRLREQEAAAAASAIRCELEVFRNALDASAKRVDQSYAEMTDAVLTFPDVSHRTRALDLIGDKIGFLHPAQIKEVIRVYGHIAQLPMDLKNHGATYETVENTDVRVALIEVNRASDFAEVAKAYVRSIDRALTIFETGSKKKGTRV